MSEGRPVPGNQGNLDVLEVCACFKVRSAARAVTSLYDEALESTGLKITQFATLSVIRSRGTVRMQRLAEELGGLESPEGDLEGSLASQREGLEANIPICLCSSAGNLPALFAVALPSILTSTL